MSAERWRNKVVDGPSPFRAHSSHKRIVATSPHRFSTVDLPGPVHTNVGSNPSSARTNPGAEGRTTPQRSSRRQIDGRSGSSSRVPSSNELDVANSLLVGELPVDRFHKRMVITPASARSPSPSMADCLSTDRPLSATSADHKMPYTDVGDAQYLYSKRMSPLRHAETTEERRLATAKSEVDIGRGRLHSLSHRNYTDDIRSVLNATPVMAGPASVSPTQPGGPSRPTLNIASSGNNASNGMKTTMKYRKNAQTSSTSDVGHWKPQASVRCCPSARPSLEGIMKPDAVVASPPFRLVPPYGVS